ncbi:hypothetical protein [Cellulomonas sp.]|uniref:hypothetical protein n=1 Tax=Cellulomonas sp. TaxID=40001 RepID=UPI001B112405|nr:hypothetical protein [Cellulomonas sp.]MBO9555533.1 hypothetical protein [Cellulomonas sp.]
MRWETLFADMEAQLDAARAAERQVQVAELTRAERATVTLADRVRASRGSRVRLLVLTGESIEGELVDSATEWLLVAPSAVQRVLVPVAAVAAVSGLAAHGAPPAGATERRLGLGHALRALARDRMTVRVSAQGADVVGRVERVGSDHLEIGATHELAGRVWTIPFASLAAVRSG